MREFSSDELDLMAQAYEQACDWLVQESGIAPKKFEAARKSMVEGIIDAMRRGEHDEQGLLSAGLSRVQVVPLHRPERMSPQASERGELV